MLQVYVVVNPTVTVVGFEVHALIPAVPLTDQVAVPIGATEPDTPVATAVNTRVELRTPVPLPVSTKEAAEALAIETGVAATEPRAV